MQRKPGGKKMEEKRGGRVGIRKKKRIMKELSVPPTWQRAAHGVWVRNECQRHRGHKVVGHRLSIVLHVRAENSLAHEIDGAHHEQRHHHCHDVANGLVGRGGRLLRCD